MTTFEVVILTIICTYIFTIVSNVIIVIFKNAWREYKRVDDGIKRIFLIDIDGTVSDDIKNEDSHLYADAHAYTDARDVLNRWHDNGHTITFFTARESKDRKVTEDWLTKNGFKYDSLLMDKPRIKDGQEYVWIDNRKVRAVTYKGTWSDLTRVEAEIDVFI